VRITFRVRNAGGRECDVWLYWSLRALNANARELAESETGPGRVKFDRICQTRQPSDQSERLIWQPEIPPPGFMPVIQDGKSVVRGESQFVGAGVTQEYTLTTSLDQRYALATVAGSINYTRSRSRLARLMTPLARVLSGLSSRETSDITFDHDASCV